MKFYQRLDIIDLDEEENADIGAKERQLILHLTVCYILGKMPNASLIQMKVFIGLLPAIAPHAQKALPALTLFIASIGLSYTDLSVLMRAIMVMEEIKRIFTLDEQHIILSELERRRKK